MPLTCAAFGRAGLSETLAWGHGIRRWTLVRQKRVDKSMPPSQRQLGRRSGEPAPGRRDYPERLGPDVRTPLADLQTSYKKGRLQTLHPVCERSECTWTAKIPCEHM